MKGIDIQVATQSHCPSNKEIKLWIKTALLQQNKKGSLVVRIVDEEEMTTLNHQFRNKQKPTNVLSFSTMIPEPLRGDMLGDIVICAAVVAKEALEQHKAVQAHWAHMVIHGVLHLLGHDHEKGSDANVMEQSEIEILHQLGFADPYKVEDIYE
jgi:probable rRNA maturation factor